MIDDSREYFFFSFIGIENKQRKIQFIDDTAGGQTLLYECFYYGDDDLKVYETPVLDLVKEQSDPRKNATNRDSGLLLSVHFGADPATYASDKTRPEPWDVFYKWCTFNDILDHLGMSKLYERKQEELILEAIHRGFIEDATIFKLLGPFPNLLNSESVRNVLIKTFFKAWYTSDNEEAEKATALLRLLVPKRPKGKLLLVPAEFLEGYHLARGLMKKLAGHLSAFIRDGIEPDPEEYAKEDPRFGDMSITVFDTLMKTPAKFVDDYIQSRLNRSHETYQSIIDTKRNLTV